MNGNTATYMQYAYARIQSIFRKGGCRAGRNPRPEAPDDRRSHHPAERALGVRLLRLPEVLEFAAAELKPNVLTDLPVRPGQCVSARFSRNARSSRPSRPSVATAAWRCAT